MAVRTAADKRSVVGRGYYRSQELSLGVARCRREKLGATTVDPVFGNDKMPEIVSGGTECLILVDKSNVFIEGQKFCRATKRIAARPER
jgi:hypothetical protein